MWKLVVLRGRKQEWEVFGIGDGRALAEELDEFFEGVEIASQVGVGFCIQGEMFIHSGKHGGQADPQGVALPKPGYPLDEQR
jgi:hypothetical protein